MCSIGGVFSKNGSDVFGLLLDLLFAQVHRGQDGFGIAVGQKVVHSNSLAELRKKFLKGNAGICHSLLSVTGRQLQPVSMQGESTFFAHNGQIYNFREIGSRGMSNDSQCIPVFLQGGFKKKLPVFFRRAVGSFAVGVLEKNSIHAFRDVVGIKPVWFGENSDIFAFASEPQALKKIGIYFPHPLLPGHLVSFSASGFSEEKVFDLIDFKKTVPKKTSFGGFFKSFESAIEWRTGGLKKCGVFFSGGVDSSVIAKAVSERVADVTLFTAGLSGSVDLSFSDRVAGEMGLKLVVSEIQKDSLAEISLGVLQAMGQFDLMQLGIAVPIFVCAGAARENGLKVVFSGQASDEIFCGYSSYKAILAQGGPKAVQGQIWSALGEMWSRNLFREDIVSMHFSLEHRLPFLDLDFLRHAMALPVSEKISSPSDSLRKHAVRKIAVRLGVPKTAVEREKKAVQYGSGVQKELSRLF